MGEGGTRGLWLRGRFALLGPGGALLEGDGEMGRSFVCAHVGGVELCRALGPAHRSKKHLCETVGLRPRHRRQRLRLESTSRPSLGKGR